MKQTTLICQQCQQPFELKLVGYNETRKFCSVACYNAFRSPAPDGPIAKVCLTCGNGFHTKRAAQRWCSQSCNKNYPRHSLVCKLCGIGFQSKRPGALYCSRACRGRDNRTLPDKNCMECGKLLTRIQLVGKGQRFCSRVCNRAYWTRTGTKDAHGYIGVHTPNHPFADSRGRVSQHRLVMEQVLGRYLLPVEIVHHKNGIRDDNRPENLELLTRTTHHNGFDLICPKCDHHF